MNREMNPPSSGERDGRRRPGSNGHSPPPPRRPEGATTRLTRPGLASGAGSAAAPCPTGAIRLTAVRGPAFISRVDSGCRISLFRSKKFRKPRKQDRLSNAASNHIGGVILSPQKLANAASAGVHCNDQPVVIVEHPDSTAHGNRRYPLRSRLLRTRFCSFLR